MLGNVYDVQPVPPNPQHTTYFEAGPLRIGIEYRVVTPEDIAATYDGADLEEIEQNSPEGGFSDEGLSIHVISVTDDHEYIRFDAFDDDPHYHYVDKAAGTNTVIGYDTAANGPVLGWVHNQLLTRLDPMLRRAGASHIADSLSSDQGDLVIRAITPHLQELGIAFGDEYEES